MPAGLTIINDNNVVQIDENFRNLVLQSKQTVSIATVAQTVSAIGTVYTGTASVPVGTPCLVAVSASVGVAVGPQTTTGSVSLYAKASTQATVYVFCPPAASGTAGLQVFNAAGEPVFDSALQYMRVVSAVQIPNRVTPTDAAYTYAAAPAGTYAVVQSHSREYASLANISGLGVSLIRFRDFFTTAGNGFSVSNVPIYLAPGQGSATYAASDLWALQGSVVLLVDVAGL